MCTKNKNKRIARLVCGVIESKYAKEQKQQL